MSSQASPDETFSIDKPAGPSAASQIRQAIKPLASLKLTVSLFGFSIFLILAGTLAQVELDIWDVVRDYFRCWFAWVPVRTFHPLFAPYLDLSGVSTRIGMWFPGGYLIGTLMAINLATAHSLKFTVQAKGPRLTGGLLVTGIGMVATWLVIESGHSDNSVQAATIGWDTLWSLLKFLSVSLLLTTAWGITSKWSDNRAEALSLCGVFAILTTAAWFLFNPREALIDDSGMRILWQLIKGCGASVIMLAGCMMLFRKRAGVVLLHAGVGLMMLNEVVVDTAHVETQMRINEGESVNFSDDIRGFELAFVNRSREDFNDEIVIPKSMVVVAGQSETAEGKVLSNAEMPFNVEIVQFLQNSNPLERRQIRIEVAATLGVPPFQISGAEKLSDLNADSAKVDAVFDSLATTLGTEFSPALRKRLSTVDEVVNYVFDEHNPASTGPGEDMIVSEVRPGAGTDSGGAVDLTAAYVRVIDKATGKELGTFLTGVFFELVKRSEWAPNRVVVDGQTWDVYLRFKRHYKPYTVQLKDVSKTDYVGTSTPRDYRSVVRIVEPKAGEDFEQHIWMNNPLRYAGETFYQSNYGPPDPVTQKESTTLAVVSNTGWMIPYVSCMIVATGMLAHFWIVMVRFLRRRDVGQTSPGTSSTPQTQLASYDLPESLVVKIIPWVVMLLFAGWLVSKSRMPSYESTQANLQEFGKLPLVYEGRVKPFDTLARNSLRILSNRETYKDKNGDTQPAILWLLDVIANPSAAREHRVFRIDHPQILKQLELERRKSHLYSLDDFFEKIPVLVEMANEARSKDSKERNADERKFVELHSKLGTFDLLVTTFQPPDIRIDEFDQEKIRTQVQAAMRVLQQIDERQPPLAVPPVKSDAGKDFTASEDWETFARGITKSYLAKTLLGQETSQPVEFLTEIMVAHSNGNAEDFNKRVGDYHRWLAKNKPEDLDAARVSFETFFNNFSPFYYSAFSYLFAFVFAVAGLLGWSRSLNRTAFLVILATFCVHTFALGARIYISGRPPVTNLYSSAVFIGWGCVLMGMVFESIYKLGIGNIIGASLGAITLGISHLLSGDGDTFKVLQAVLDTQFWLATHVVCITLGYSTTFLAGTLGLYYVLAGVISTRVTAETRKDLSRMIYGTVCFGIFFSFVGTVLGGLWADDSWGRFWGWDPKENGALLIVLWNAILLHAHWDKMVGPRGLAVLAVGGNVVTSWSWFGVNELSVGLHAYGFTEGVWATLWAFWLSQAVVMIVGVLPTRFWRSYAGAPATVAETDARPADAEA
ncbi:MAG: cytochrome c biogenesis protein CcsA [Planctomycetota bacterium]|nr:cytochrome c biogenesis protein CcsA [Planctomycetota bacterium]